MHALTSSVLSIFDVPGYSLERFLEDINYKPQSRDDWIDIEEVIRQSKRGDTTVRMAIKSGYLKSAPSSGKRGKILIRQSWLDEWIISGCKTGYEKGMKFKDLKPQKTQNF